ncbi:MAG: site-2 protease family protein [Cyanobacteria bacterium SID2]|nr:site-2 protease family protein [Cyanobacteria bacterium SID2]MBP0002663.1 site-2 protease family protein [Cyanobacteria bacterium SBC]
MFLRLLVADPILFSRIIVIIIISITLHELSHGIAAISQGDDTPQSTGHMTLNPVVHLGVSSIVFLCLAGIAWGQMPVNPRKFRHPKWSNIIVSAAGPLLNLALGVLFVIFLKINVNWATDSIVSSEFLYLVARLNLILFLFNLIPIPPLDGFHVFSEFFPSFKSLQNSQMGMLFLAILFVGGASRILAQVVDLLICMALNPPGYCLAG